MTLPPGGIVRFHSGAVSVTVAPIWVAMGPGRFGGTGPAGGHGLTTVPPKVTCSLPSAAKDQPRAPL